MRPSRTVAVLGGNGVYARHLIPRLVGAGYAVRALVRRPEAAGLARACGAEVRVTDIFDEEALCAALDGCAVGVNVATSLPGPSGRGDYQANDQLRRNGTPIWVRACARAGVPRIGVRAAVLGALNSRALPTMIRRISTAASSNGSRALLRPEPHPTPRRVPRAQRAPGAGDRAATAMITLPPSPPFTRHRAPRPR